MKKIFKKLSKLSTIGLISIFTIPTLTACNFNLNFSKGEIVDADKELNDENNSGGNNKQGTLPQEFIEIENNSQNNKLHTMNVTNEIKFLDYNLPVTDAQGLYKYAHERGELTTKNMNLNVLENVDDFLKRFDFKTYQAEFNKQIDQSNSNFLSPIQTPTSKSFLDDIYYWLMHLYYDSNSSFDISIVKNNINFDNENNKLSFDLSFNLKVAGNDNITLSMFDNNISLKPNLNYSLNIKATNQLIKNVINSYSNRYFLGWQLPNVTIEFNNEVNTYTNFNPTKTSSSFAYPIEFFNLTSELDTNITTNKDAKAFMESLSPNIIADNISNSISTTTDYPFVAFPHLAKIFEALSKDLTIGDFLYQSSEPLVNMLVEFKVIPQGLAPMLIDVLKSTHTGEGILNIIVKHKESIGNILKELLSGILGNLTDLVDTILAPIKPGMSKDEVEGFLKLLDMFFSGDQNSNDINTTKGLITIMLKFVLGDFDANGNQTLPGNPFIFDILDYLLNTSRRDGLYKVINDLVKLDRKIFDSIATIYLTLVARDKNTNEMTTPVKGVINYKEKLITKLFDISYTDNLVGGSWWLLDQVIIILNAAGVNVGTDSTNLIFDLLQQAYSHKLNRTHFNATNALLVLTELANAFKFLSDKNNFDVVKEFVPLKDGTNVRYDNKTFEYEFNFKYKLIFKKAFTFNVDTILNFLPSDLFLELSKLLGKDSIDVNFIGTITVNLKQRYVHLNLDRLIYKMLPQKLAFEVGDSLNIDFSSQNYKLSYSQKSENGKYYHGFNSIMDASLYFEQAKEDSGIISNIMKTAWKATDWNAISNNHEMDKSSTGLNATVDVKYEKQSAQNVTALKEIVQKLFLNKINFNVNLSGTDKSKVIGTQYLNNVYYTGNTFKWLDLDLTKDFISTDGGASFKSEKYKEYWSMFQYTNTSDAVKYSYVSDNKGNITSESLSRQSLNLDNAKLDTLKKDLFTLGSGVDASKTSVSIKLITNLSIKKTVDLSILSLLNKTLTIDIQLMMLQASVVTPNNVLDLSNATRNNDSYSLSTYNYSNVFSKFILAPRIAITMPSF